MFGEKIIAAGVTGLLQNKRGNMATDEVSMQRERDKRNRRRVIALGSVSVLAAAGVFGVNGVQRAIERNPVVTTNTIAEVGEAEIISFNAEYEAHCWTATTIKTQASMKDETKVAGVSVGWHEYKAEAQYENKLCIDGTSLEYEVNTGTGHVNINIPDKDSLRTQTDVVMGTIAPHEDQTPSYVLGANAIAFFESVPVVEDTGWSKDLSAGQDKNGSAQLNTALLIGAKNTINKCAQTTWKLASKPVEHGLKRLVSLGLKIAKKMSPKIDPENISVTVENQPIAEVEVAGNSSNIDAAYSQIQKYDDENESFTIASSFDGDCKVSDSVTVLPTESNATVKTAAMKGKSNE